MDKRQARELLRCPSIPVGRTNEAKYAAMRPFLKGKPVDLNEVVDLLPFVGWACVPSADHLKVAAVVVSGDLRVEALILISQKGTLEIFGPGEIHYMFGNLDQW